MSGGEGWTIDQLIKYAADNPVEAIHEYNVDFKARHIYLVGETDYVGEETENEPGVEFVMASRLIKNLNMLMRHGEDPILIHMKTNGGDWEEGMAIYDMIKACPVPVCILNYTHARSMSSIIFQAADKRVMMPHSIFMFHDGTMSVDGTAKQYLTEAEELRKDLDIMMEIYAEAIKTKSPKQKWQRMSKDKIKQWLRIQMDKKEDVYLTAEQTVELGLADAVFGADEHYDWGSLLKF